MRSIKERVESNLIINKSEFLNFLIPVSTIEEVKRELSDLRDIYPDANHHCTAYILGKNQEIQKYDDDGEPSKTAGMPMIEVLKKHDLTNVLMVSVRYFGGIKLGAGGLVRAYTKSVSEVIKQAEFSSLQVFYQVEVIIPFDMIGVVEKHVRDSYTLLDTAYTNFVTYSVEIPKDSYPLLTISITERTKGVASYKVIQETERYV